MNELIKQARELREKATPGPWKSKETADYSEIYDNHSWGKALNPLAMVGSNLEDATFIAASRTIVQQLCDALEAMTARAEAAEAERDACKADLKSMADWYRDSVCDDGICGWCKQDADHGLDGYANECAGFYKNDCFEWRGRKEQENG